MAVFLATDLLAFKAMCDRNSITPKDCPGCDGIWMHSAGCEVAVRQRAIEAISSETYGFDVGEMIKIPHGIDPFEWVRIHANGAFKKLPESAADFWLLLSARISEVFEDPWVGPAVFARNVRDKIVEISSEGENRGW